MKLQHLIPVLLVLLGVQLLLAFWLWSGKEEMVPARDRLLPFDRAAVDGIEIRDAEGNSVTVNKIEGVWRLPQRFDFPAAGFRVDGLLEGLAELRPGLAVATSDEAAQRFRVGDTGYERRIRLLQGTKELAMLYLGDAAGPRRSYGRAAGDAAIYPLVFSAFDAEAKVDSWTDKTWLHHDPANLKALQLGDMRLARNGDGWRLADQSEGEQIDDQAAADLVRRLTSMNFMAVQGKADAKPTGKPLLTASLIYGDGPDGAERSVDFQFFDPGQQGDPLLWVSDRDYLLRIASFDVKPLTGMTRDMLLKPAAAETPQDEADASQQAQPGETEAVVPAS